MQTSVSGDGRAKESRVDLRRRSLSELSVMDDSEEID
jgi:hypothetical protein